MRYSQAQQQMEIECSFLTVNRKAPVKRLISPGNGGSPCGIDDFRVHATDAGLHSLICDCWKLCQWSEIPGNVDALLKDQKFHVKSPQSRRDCGYHLFSFQNKTILTYSSGEKTIAAFGLNFCQLKSTNFGNNMSNVQSFPSIIVGMASD